MLKFVVLIVLLNVLYSHSQSIDSPICVGNIYNEDAIGCKEIIGTLNLYEFTRFSELTLEKVTGSVEIESCNAGGPIDLSSLKSVGGLMSFFYNIATRLDVGVLEIGGQLSFIDNNIPYIGFSSLKNHSKIYFFDNSGLQTLEFPSLEDNDSIHLERNLGLTALNLNALKNTNTINLIKNNVLVNLEFPVLKESTTISINENEELVSASFPQLVTSTEFYMYYNPSLESVAVSPTLYVKTGNIVPPISCTANILLTFLPENCIDCDANFYGENCDMQCSCSGDLTCNDGVTGDGTCDCDPGFYGEHCDQVCDCVDGLVCNDGQSGDGTCDCKPFYFGSDCSQPCDCFHGECNDGISGDGHCSCDPGYEGDNCASISTCEGCANGQCETGICVCDEGFNGDLCDTCILECVYLGAQTDCFCPLTDMSKVIIDENYNLRSDKVEFHSTVSFLRNVTITSSSISLYGNSVFNVSGCLNTEKTEFILNINKEDMTDGNEIVYAIADLSCSDVVDHTVSIVDTECIYSQTSTDNKLAVKFQCDKSPEEFPLWVILTIISSVVIIIIVVAIILVISKGKNVRKVMPYRGKRKRRARSGSTSQQPLTPRNIEAYRTDSGEQYPVV